MASQPQNPEFRYNPENFHPCVCIEEDKKTAQENLVLIPYARKIPSNTHTEVSSSA